MTEEPKIGPTGRIRYRSHQGWFTRPHLVLQIEVTESANEGTSSYTYWRDALTEDLTGADVK